MHSKNNMIFEGIKLLFKTFYNDNTSIAFRHELVRFSREGRFPRKEEKCGFSEGEEVKSSLHMLLLKYQGICERMERERERKEGRRKGSREIKWDRERMVFVVWT